MLKLIGALVLGAGLIYVTFFVSFGNKTLFQHLTAISHTAEARELEGEVDNKIDTVKRDVEKHISARAEDRARQPIVDRPAEPRRPDPGQPSAADRAALDRLLKDKSR